MKPIRCVAATVYFLILLLLLVPSAHAALVIWANNGEDKITRDELRAGTDAGSVTNSAWDGSKITISGARNEVVAFNLVLESATKAATNVTVSFNTLTGPSGARISSKTATKDTLFDWTGRNIELFYIRYLEIKGLSLLAYDALYDERHVPKRFQRPWTGEGEATGTWEDRPDHNKLYPDIAVPLELESPFDITADKNQSVWTDIYIPKTSTPGTYTGTITINYTEGDTQSIPVELTVYDFTLPDYPSAPSMLYYSSYNIFNRYLGQQYIYSDSNLYTQSLDLLDAHFKLAHRHKISLIGEETLTTDMNQRSIDRLSGDLFTSANGYDGPGVNTGNNVFSIGTYSAWTYSWSDSSKQEMWTNTDTWVNWFETQNFSTPTEYFLYLIDESDDYDTQEKWAKWMDDNPGPGSRLMSFATISSPSDWENNTPSLDIPCSGIGMGVTNLWENATQKLVNDSTKRFYYYNGKRPASGSYCTEDDGVSLRLNGWIQYKKKIDRWFFWESTYYNNYQGGTGETDLFNEAFTYGTKDEVDLEYARGQSGWNYMNGDGVLFYPGTDTHYPASNYGIAGPIASLRLKYWRKGIQDADYLALASAIDKTATDKIVDRMIPKVLWDYGVENPDDPSFVYTDISWSIDPDDWETARQDLADIITSGSSTVSHGCKITGLEVTGTPSTAAATTYKITAAADSGTVSYRYSIHPDYGTSGYDGKHWSLMGSSEWATNNALDYTFTSAGKYIIVVWATTGDTSQSVDSTGIPIAGWSADVSGTGCRTNFSGLTITGDQTVNQQITFTVNGTDSCEKTLYYRFSMHPDYGTSSYDGKNWQLMTNTEWTSNNSINHTFTKAGKYIVVVWVSDTDENVDSTGIPIIGWSVDIE